MAKGSDDKLSMIKEDTPNPEYHVALLEDPWVITGHSLIVQRWRPFFLESTLNIEYEYFHLICFNWGKYRHQSEDCSKMAKGGDEPIGEYSGKAGRNQVLDPSGEIPINISERKSWQKDSYDQDPLEFGPWMIVKREEINEESEQHIESGSRFNVLNKESLYVTCEDVQVKEVNVASMQEGQMKRKPKLTYKKWCLYKNVLGLRRILRVLRRNQIPKIDPLYSGRASSPSPSLHRRRWRRL
ncbi:hypothetical protein Ahy_A04g020180 [Arachis hypogaea]|uniref:DUF4283 domain-containing protein n=1 Tax=Arachis hypogaea TaxID=3818 RepID=A0A445DH57_ARAHY|nr:hypothetical protein Ahy_A04g020180 [Arachis hypogaea]